MPLHPDKSRLLEAHPTHQLDTRLTSRSVLAAYLSVWNAYDRANVAAYYWHPEEERVTPIRQWGLLPIFGLEYEF